MPKAIIQRTSKLSSKSINYLQRLCDAHEEGEVAALIKPQYHYPKTNQVYVKVQYQRANGKPYDFNKRINQATQHAQIDITKCPYATIKYLINNFPKSKVSVNKSNLLIPYTPVTQAISQAYQVLPADTVIEYDTSQPNLISLSTPTTMGTQQGTTGVPSSTNAPVQTMVQPTQTTQTQPVLPGVDLLVIAAIMATLQAAGVGAQAPPQVQPKATKMKIKEPDTYDGKN
ncbi:hypothetical protein M407DRAFT_26012 [Tulasnella calospora MUT 4182]|uniref:Uncharacterized protein n=1 Tax=Tulasnella calospora MUT 4182 TaxID=1051891 RepID=A0A0C3Q5W7_9AGAM|nr:hypothetical protein M407DRAFT_26012 [Tulasnella calospora MUT 4182]